MRPRLGRLALVVVAVLALAGCTAGPKATTTSTPDPSGASPAAQAYYGQHLAWSSCGSGFQCATAKAPLDWSTPASGSPIHLALTRLPATGHRLGSLFVNPGGPGESGVTFLKGSATTFFDPTLREHYDLVAWDPRGIGASSAVSCESTSGLDAFLFADPDEPAGSAALRQDLTTQSVDFAKGCAQRTGALLAHVDTVSTAHDLDMLRADVGDAKLTYFGFSYGTLIGSTYADLFPTRVGRMALDGTIDPSIDEFQQNLANTRAFGDALTTYLRHVQGASGAPFPGQSVAQATATIARLLVALRATPIRITDGREINGAYLRTAIDAALYDEGSWPYLTKALTDIQRGNPDYTVALADSYVDRTATGYSDNLFSAIYAVDCLDHPTERDPAVLKREGAQLDAADPLRAADDSNDLGDLTCANWPVKPTGSPHRVTATGSPTIVVIGTTGDPATPYQWAQSLAKQLPKGVLLTYRGQGHTAYRNHVACIDTPVDAYFVSGTTPRAGISCS